MIALPRPLAGWIAQLVPLAPEGQTTLGPWLPLLARLHEGFALPRAAPDGQPDGFDGLGRRGRYERLALSEWALLDAAPDEFVRRAGAGEHLFHQLTRVQTAGAGQVVALFDAGPWQLGAPRLVHLAWLLVLARHARRQGLRLGWGTLQAPDAGVQWMADDDGGDTVAAALRGLLAARSELVADAAALAAWAKVLGPAGPQQERWLICDPELAGLPTTRALGAAALAVSEGDDPDDDGGLSVEAWASGVRQRTALRMPARATCGRVLRDPFRAERNASPKSDEATLAAGAQIVIAATGLHLLARLQSGQIITLPLNPDDRSPVNPVGRFTPPVGEWVVAAGWRTGKMYVLTGTADGLRLHTSRGRRWTNPRSFTRVIPTSVRHGALAALHRLIIDVSRSHLWFDDDAWGVHLVDVPNGVIGTESESVVAWGWATGRSQMVSVRRREQGPLELWANAKDGRERAHLLDGAHRVSSGHLVFMGSGEQLAFVALGTGGGDWLLCMHPPHGVIRRLTVPADRPVYGAATLGRRACLLVRSAGGDALEFVDEKGVAATIALPDEIEHACLHPNGHLIAAQVAGGVCVVDHTGRERFRWGGRR